MDPFDTIHFFSDLRNLSPYTQQHFPGARGSG